MVAKKKKKDKDQDNKTWALAPRWAGTGTVLRLSMRNKPLSWPHKRELGLASGRLAFQQTAELTLVLEDVGYQKH